MAPFRPLRIEILQHVPFEGLGSMEAWFKPRGHTLKYVRLFAGELPSQPGGQSPGGEAPGGQGPGGQSPQADWLIVMGGPMGVHDEAEFPWLKAEKKAIEAALKRDASVLGVCLGAQLLADVLGAAVTRNPHKEIGWFPVDLSAQAASTWMGKAFPARFTPFHWHGDTFGIPAGAVRLGGSEACLNQGFLYGENALGLQFHPEVTPASLAALAEECGGELSIAGTAQGRFVMDREALEAGLEGSAGLNAMMAAACERLENRAACT